MIHFIRKKHYTGSFTEKKTFFTIRPHKETNLLGETMKAAEQKSNYNTMCYRVSNAYFFWELIVY